MGILTVWYRLTATIALPACGWLDWLDPAIQSAKDIGIIVVAVLLIILYLAVLAGILIAFALAVLAVLCIILAVIGGIALLIVLLVTVGSLTTSTLVAWKNRSLSVGFKALIVQVAAAMSALGGVGVGIALGWLVATGAQMPINLWLAGAAGGIAGLIAGILGGILFNRIWYGILNWLLRRFNFNHTLDASSYDTPATDRSPRHRNI